MSGIVGILNLNGAPVGRELLQHMTGYMDFRGPDRQAIWSRDNVGFGHAALHTTFESHGETQPQNLDQRLWITADARIDGRDELRAKLEASGRCGIVTDVELILHAYDVWQEECVQHLLGDFAFAIWDEPRHRLFCARDQLGIKPFFYAEAADCFLISNTINCLRKHPSVSERLSDHAIGDFLLCGLNCQESRTTFSDIQRLPAGHYLIVDFNGRSRVQRYWRLPLDGHVRYRRKLDYVDRFKELLDMAVANRLRTDRVAILMSGGLDSTALAATAARIGSARALDLTLRAHTIVYEKLMPCREHDYAAMVGEKFNLPIDYLAADDYGLFERWDNPELCSPEPAHYPLLAIYHDHFRQVNEHSRVAFCGDGGDPIFSPPHSHFVRLFKELRWLRLVTDAGAYAFFHGGRLPPLGFRSAVKRRLGLSPMYGSEFPSWLNPDFTARAGLHDRRRELNRAPAPLHPYRPEAYQKLTAPFWSAYFESLDPGMTLLPLEIRSPLFDVRLVSYLLAIPPLPWTADKELLRVAMRGILPEAVRLRPKTPLACDPVLAKLRRPESRWIDGFVADAKLSDYVVREKIPPVTSPDGNVSDYYPKLMPLALDLWMKNDARRKPELWRRKYYGIRVSRSRKEEISSTATVGLR